MRYAVYILASGLHGTLYIGITNRDWKVALIEEHNPDWLDLTPDLN